MNPIHSNKNFFILALILCGALSRLIPHPFNFTAVGAIALFAGVRIKDQWLAFAAPFGAMLLTDIILGNQVSLMYAVYISLGLTVVLGRSISSFYNFKVLVFSSILSTALFFLITNFFCWPGNAIYSQDFGGLLKCYTAGIPFLRNQVLGDLFFNTLFHFSFVFFLTPKPMGRPFGS